MRLCYRLLDCIESLELRNVRRRVFGWISNNEIDFYPAANRINFFIP